MEIQKVAVAGRVAGNGGSAGAIQSGQKRSFAVYRIGRFAMIDSSEQILHARVANPAFQRNRPLTGSGRECRGVQNFCRNGFLLKPFQASKGEQSRIGLPLFKLAKARVHQTAKNDHVDIGAQATDECLASKRGRAHRCRMGKLDQSCSRPADESISNIFAREIGGKVQPIRQPCRHVLGAMHRKIQVSGQKLGFQLFGKQSFAADFRQGAIRHPVSLGGKRNDLEHVLRKTVRSHQAVTGFKGLYQGKRAAARANSERFCLHPLLSIVTGGVRTQVSEKPQSTNRLMTPILRILGIETSCDETAASVVVRHANGQGDILSDVVLSQLEEHSAYGGVVPEIAARAHVEALDRLIEEALTSANVSLSEIDAVAATSGPGLIGGLIVGLMTGKAIARAANKPLYAINHLEGHALTARLTDGLPFPYLMLLVSGGHTQLILVRGVGEYERWGTTIDDALGEAFDKTAKLLGLPYPGGPAVEKAAAKGNADRFNLPRPMVGEARLDFSFSGLKTAVRQAATAIAPLSEQDIADICASFQKAVSRTLKDRIGRGLQRFMEEYPDVSGKPALVVAGGVAANQEIRRTLQQLCEIHHFRFVAPPLHLCTDNAVMIGWAGLERMALGIAPDSLDVQPRSRWPLDAQAQTLIGFGKRGAKA